MLDEGSEVKRGAHVMAHASPKINETGTRTDINCLYERAAKLRCVRNRVPESTNAFRAR